MKILNLLFKLKYIMLIILFMAINSIFSEEFESRWSNIRNCEELNSQEDEFAPVYDSFRQILYFNSTANKFSYFYQTKFFDSISFEIPKLTKGDLNKINNNQCCLSILSPSEAYFQTYKITDKYPIFNIFKLTYLKNSWSSPILVDSINTNSFTAFPAVSQDGSFMVFSSIRNGNSDDIDLFMTIKNQDGTWSVPVSIDELNSPGNEITPFIAGNDTLYYSSDGQEGTGKYDIYFSVRNGSEWLRPRPLIELNTEFDETDFKLINENLALFCSDRIGGKGKSDIYLVNKVSIKQKKNIETPIEITLKTQTLSIQVEKSYEYNIYPLFFRFNSNDIELLTEPARLNGTGLSLLDSLYINSLLTISDRLSNYPNSKIKITSNQNELLKEFFENKQVNFNQLEFVAHTDNSILIESYSEEIVKYNEIGKTEFIVNPPALDIIFDARPKEDINSCEIHILLDGKLSKIKEYSGTLPLQFLAKTNVFAEYIFNAERAVLMAIAKDKNDNIQNEELSFNIIREERRGKQFLFSNKNKYEVFFVNYESQLNSEISNFNSIIQSIKESASYSKSISIEYIDDSSKIIAEKLMKFLNNLKLSNIKLQKIEDITKFRYISNYNKLLRVLIEKY